VVVDQIHGAPQRVHPSPATLFFPKIQQIFFIKRYVEFPKELLVLILERPFGVVLILVLYVPNYRIQLRARIGKAAESRLPPESSFDPAFLIYEIGRTLFHFPHKIRESNIRFDTEKHMKMIWLRIYREQLLAFVSNNPGDVFVEFLCVRGLD